MSIAFAEDSLVAQYGLLAPDSPLRFQQPDKTSNIYHKADKNLYIGKTHTEVHALPFEVPSFFEAFKSLIYTADLPGVGGLALMGEKGQPQMFFVPEPRTGTIQIVIPQSERPPYGPYFSFQSALNAAVVINQQLGTKIFDSSFGNRLTAILSSSNVVPEIFHPVFEAWLKFQLVQKAAYLMEYAKKELRVSMEDDQGLSWRALQLRKGLHPDAGIRKDSPFSLNWRFASLKKIDFSLLAKIDAELYREILRLAKLYGKSASGLIRANDSLDEDFLTAFLLTFVKDMNQSRASEIFRRHVEAIGELHRFRGIVTAMGRQLFFDQAFSHILLGENANTDLLYAAMSIMPSHLQGRTGHILKGNYPKINGTFDVARFLGPPSLRK